MVDLFNRLAVALNSVSIARVDFPPPDTPETHVIKPTGNSTVIFLRLLPVAPLTIIFLFVGFLRLYGMGILFSPLRY